MSHSRMRSGLVRVLAVYLVLALTPTPLVVSWFLTRSSPAAAAVEEDFSPAASPSLTDLAAPQPRLVSPASDGPDARLARMGLNPHELSGEEEQAASGTSQASASEVREAQLTDLTRQLGNQALAAAVIVEFEKPRAGTPPLHSPTLEPSIPDPFVRLPAQANYKRADQVLESR